MDHLVLAAADVGLQPISGFDPAAAREVLAIPDEAEPMLFMLLGLPAADAVPSPRHAERRPLGELRRGTSAGSVALPDRGSAGTLSLRR